MGIYLSMTLDDETEHPVGETLRRHYDLRVTPEVAAKHTMAIHREAARIRVAHRRELRSSWRPRRAVVASLVGAMLVGSSTGALAASEETLPGDLLYGVKRTSEQARLLAASTFAREGLVHLDIARMRVHEAQLAAPVRPVAVIEQLTAEAEAALDAARAEGVPNVGTLEAELLADASAAIAVSEATEEARVAAAPTPGPAVSASPSSPSPSPSPSAPVLVPSPSPSASPSQVASPQPSASEPSVEPSSPSEPESSTVGVPAPTPSPTP